MKEQAGQNRQDRTGRTEQAGQNRQADRGIDVMILEGKLY
jgi:hypothetical protein